MALIHVLVWPFCVIIFAIQSIQMTINDNQTFSGNQITDDIFNFTNNNTIAFWLLLIANVTFLVSLIFDFRDVYIW